jgi:hypothetical protein
MMKSQFGPPSRNALLRTIAALHHPTNHVVVTSLKRQVVHKKYAIDDVMKISYLSLLGVRDDRKLERTSMRSQGKTASPARAVILGQYS